jgi:hypothetical protein
MENESRERQRKGYVLTRMIYDISVASIILLIGIVVLFGDKFKVQAITNIVSGMDPLMRYIFGGICFLYGGFRLYRGIRHEY